MSYVFWLYILKAEKTNSIYIIYQCKFFME